MLKCKGQLISKCLIGIFNSPKKRMKKFDYNTSIELFSFVFWKELKTPIRHFEINWPLVEMVTWGKEWWRHLWTTLTAHLPSGQQVFTYLLVSSIWNKLPIRYHLKRLVFATRVHCKCLTYKDVISIGIPVHIPIY